MKTGHAGTGSRETNRAMLHRRHRPPIPHTTPPRCDHGKAPPTGVGYGCDAHSYKPSAGPRARWVRSKAGCNTNSGTRSCLEPAAERHCSAAAAVGETMTHEKP